eukprot:jgi/Botrbrau1/18020/Bobra.0062s0012.1
MGHPWGTLTVVGVLLGGPAPVPAARGLDRPGSPAGTPLGWTPRLDQCQPQPTHVPRSSQQTSERITSYVESCDQWESGNSSWPHIICNPQRRVIALCLSGKGCRGPLPQELGRLTYLTLLDLSNKGPPGTLHSNWTFLTDPTTESLLDPQHAMVRAEVASLNLSRYELSGTVPAVCCNVTQLAKIVRLRNIINGTLPAAWSQLAHLTYLRLSYNRLSGSLPSAWGNLTELKSLGLIGNRLTGPLPRSWSGMRALTGLYLWNNSLTGTLPSEWGNLTRLSNLHLKLNRLSGTLPSAWGSGMAALTSLYMSNNSLSGTLPSEWGNLTVLEKLHMNLNQLSGLLPRSWGGMSALKELDLSNNSLSGYLPKAWGSLAQLEVLDLDSNDLTGPLRTEWSGMGALQSLDLYINRLSGTLPHEWSNFTQIVNLDLSDNRFSGTLPETWEVMEGLEWLNLASNELSGVLPPSWGSFTELRTCRLGSNRLGGSLPDAWANLTQLNWLDLSRNNLTGGLPQEWAQMSNLQILDLTINGLTGTLPSKWAELAQLAFLELSGNALSGSLPTVWANLTSLAGLRIAQNNLSGPLPDDWGSLSSLIVLDISQNDLDGTLPSSWGNLTGGMLNLQGNRLKGTLPGNMSISPLVVLLLSGNALTGTLPREWEAPGLQVLSVGNNRLHPPVPNGWWNGTSFPNITLLDVGGLMWDTAGGRDWKAHVCRDAAVFNLDNPKKLASIVAQNLLDALPMDIDETANIFADLNLEGLLLAIPTDSFDSIEGLCKNKNVATLLGAMWGALLAVLALGSLLHWAFASYWVHVFREATDYSIMSELSAAVMASLYWYDWVTDALVIMEVWKQKWGKWLLAFALVNYGISGFIVTFYILRKEGVGSRRWRRVVSFFMWWVLTVALMPILDTVAAVQLLFKDWNVRLVEVRLDAEAYLHMRDVVRAVFTAVPVAILTSLTYAIGTRPDQGVVYTTSTFVASICGAMMLVVWAWFVALHYARAPDSEGGPPGIFNHLRHVLTGATLHEEAEEPYRSLEDSVKGIERERLVHLIKIWQSSAGETPGPPGDTDPKDLSILWLDLPKGCDIPIDGAVSNPEAAAYEGIGGARKRVSGEGDGATWGNDSDDAEGGTPSSVVDEGDGAAASPDDQWATPKSNATSGHGTLRAALEMDVEEDVPVDGVNELQRGLDGSQTRLVDRGGSSTRQAHPPWWKAKLPLLLQHVREKNWRVGMLLLRALVVLGPTSLAILIEFYK